MAAFLSLAKSQEGKSAPGGAQGLLGAVFDFDGLLADTESLEFESWRMVYREAGSDLTHEIWTQAVGWSNHFDPQSDLESRVGRKLDWEALHKRRIEDQQKRLQSLQPLPGAVELVGFFLEKGLLVSCASNSSSDWVKNGLKRIGLDSHISIIVGREQVSHPKPAPDPYLKATAAMGVPPGCCIAFEDSGPGVRSAASAGLWTVAVPNPLTFTHDFSPAHLRLKSLSEFLPFAEKIRLSTP